MASSGAAKVARYRGVEPAGRMIAMRDERSGTSLRRLLMAYVCGALLALPAAQGIERVPCVSVADALDAVRRRRHDRKAVAPAAGGIGLEQRLGVLVDEIEEFVVRQCHHRTSPTPTG